MNHGNLQLYQSQKRPPRDDSRYRPSILVSNGKCKRTYVLSREIVEAVDRISDALQAPQSHVIEFLCRRTVAEIEAGRLEIPTVTAVTKIRQPRIALDAAGDD